MTVLAKGADDIPDKWKIPAQIDGYNAVITNLFGPGGDEVEFPPKAVVAVGYFEEGPQRGGWFTTECAGWTWTHTDEHGAKVALSSAPMLSESLSRMNK